MDVNDIKHIAAAKGEITIPHARGEKLRDSIFNEAFRHASEWYADLSIGEVRVWRHQEKKYRSKKKKSLYKRGYKHVYSRMDQPAGLISSFLWWLLARAIIAWIIGKIIDYIIDTYWE